jgi:hypothetical protein
MLNGNFLSIGEQPFHRESRFLKYMPREHCQSEARNLAKKRAGEVADARDPAAEREATARL